MERIKNLLETEPVVVINAIVAVAAVLAGLGLDIDPTAVGSAVLALMTLAGITRASVWSPASVDEVVDAAVTDIDDAWGETWVEGGEAE